MKPVNSPNTGKPMRVVYEPDVWEIRGEKYPYVHIAYRDDESGEQFTTTESDTVGYVQATNQYRERHGIPYTDEIIALRESYGLSAAKMSVILGFGALVAIVFLIHWHKIVPAAGVLLYGFLTIRLDDATILDFLKYAVRYFITTQQEYRWR